jgi:hypothetical protein
MLAYREGEDGVKGDAASEEKPGVSDVTASE